jgi:nuclear pore complex protein Nup205
VGLKFVTCRLSPVELGRDTDLVDPVTLPSGASVQFVGEILKWPTTISQILNISELLAAVIAIQADSLRYRYPSRSVPEIAVFIYHNWLSESLDFLRELLRLTIGPQAEEGAPFDTLREGIGGLLNARTSLGEGKSEGTLVDQIIGQLDDLSSRLGSLLRTGPVGGVEYELLSFRVTAIRAEQNKLAGVLAAIAEGGYLGRGQVIKVLKWLKKCDQVDGLVGVILS